MLLLFLFSCYNNMYHFENDDLEWAIPYNEGDTIRLETNNGVDLLCINEKAIHDTYNIMAPHEGKWGADFFASIEYNGYILHNSNKHNVYLLLKKNDKGGIGGYVNFGWRYCNAVENDLRNVNGLGTSIKDTIIIDDANSHYGGNGPAADDFEYFKWSKKEGLIEYRLRDGTVYPNPND